MFNKLSREEKQFYAWYNKGIKNEWITPTFCSTHDGGMEYWSNEEASEWEEGGDPCMVVTRVRYIG
jgi:hypothetical protein